MKMNFEEPKVVVESFSVADVVTTSWIVPGENETNPYDMPAVGGN